MRPPRLLVTCILIAAATVLAACGNAPPPTPDPDSSPLDEFSLQPDSEVPDMTITLYQGSDMFGEEEVTLHDILAEGKPVVLNFWAALCPPCRVEMPEFQRVHEARQHEAILMGIDIGPQFHLGTREQGRDLLQQLEVHYPAGTTYNENVGREFSIVGMPTTLFIYPDGRLLRAWNGLLTESKLNELIDELLEEPV